MSIALLVKTLLDAGVDHATVVAAVEAVERPAIDEQAERRRAADRERKRDAKILRNSAESAESVEPPSLEVSPHAPLPKPNPLNPSKNTPKGVQKGSPSQALLTVLAPETAQAVVEHRQRMRAPLTFHAAELLARKLAACPDPQAAAEAMMANGWRGIDAAWMERQQPRGQPPPQPVKEHRNHDFIQAFAEIVRHEPGDGIHRQQPDAAATSSDAGLQNRGDGITVELDADAARWR
jgi:hypothetical protein